jgi:hypothetical protein
MVFTQNWLIKVFLSNKTNENIIIHINLQSYNCFKVQTKYKLQAFSIKSKSFLIAKDLIKLNKICHESCKIDKDFEWKE